MDLFAQTAAPNSSFVSLFVQILDLQRNHCIGCVHRTMYTLGVDLGVCHSNNIYTLFSLSALILEINPHIPLGGKKRVMEPQRHEKPFRLSCGVRPQATFSP